MLVVTVDAERAVALVRGPDAKRICTLLGGDPKWSTSSRGWVVPDSVVADLVAYAQSVHKFVVVSDRKEAAT